MSIAAQTAVALARATTIGAIALALSGPLNRWIASMQGRERPLAWALLLAPFFTPPLLVSYAFSSFALALVVSPWTHEALYVGVLAVKLVPVAVVVRWLLPSPLSAEARHIHRTLAVSSWRQRAVFAARGAGGGPWIAGGLVFVLAFSDFELASLWSVRTWTVALFDAQTGGLALRETFRLAAGPLAVEVVVLALLYRGATRVPPGRAAAVRAQTSGTPWLYVAGAGAIVSLLPLGIVATQAAAGFRVLGENFVLGRQLASSALFATGAMLLADTLARVGRRHSRFALLLGVPGLLGALVVALVVLALFQTPPLRPAYDTPLPLLIAQTLILLPLALLLAALRPAPSPALHLARRSGSGRLVWEMETRPRFAALGLLFCWAWFDFTESSILAPVGFTPVFVRLHNLAHYGQTAVLSAMLLASFAAPLLALSLVGVVVRFRSVRS